MWREGVHLAMAEAWVDLETLSHKLGGARGSIVLSHIEAAAKVITAVVSARGRGAKREAWL